MFYEQKSLNIQSTISHSLAFPAHLHHHIELVYLLEGSSKAFIDSIEYDISTNDLLIIFPNQIHHYQTVSHEKSIVLIFPPDICLEYKSIFTGSLPTSSLIKNLGANKKILLLLESILTQNNSSSTYTKLILKGHFLILLGELFEMLDLQPVSNVRINVLKDILVYCSHNYKQALKLQNLERDLHISKYRISHLFNEKLQISFKDYINMLRVSYACNILLSEDIKIIDICYLSGFNSPRSFNRSFIKYTGMTPKEYRNNNGLPLISP